LAYATSVSVLINLSFLTLEQARVAQQVTDKM